MKKPELRWILRVVALASLLFVSTMQQPISVEGRVQEPSLSSSKRPLPAASFIQPVIYHPSRIDRDSNGIQDSLENLISATLESGVSFLPVVVTLNNPVSSQDLNHFVMLGGRVSFVYRYVTYGFAGIIPFVNVSAFARFEGDNLAVVEFDAPVRYHLDYSGSQTRVRPTVWDTYGYSGSSNQSIAVVDTGIDDSHPDLGPFGDLNFSRRIVGWYDASGDGALTPEDYGEHGTHVAGIAAGSGGANSLQGSGTVKTTFTYVLPQTGYGYIDYVDVMNPGYIRLNCSWGGNNRVLLRLYNPAGIGVAETSGTGKPLLLNYDTSGTSYPTGRYRVLVGNLAGASGNPFSAVETYPYQGRNDGRNLFTGVAPNSRLVGVKVFDNAGSGTTSTVMAGLDWILENRFTYHIVVASMSLGLGNGAVDSTLDQKVDTMVRNGIVTTVSAGNDYPDSAIGSPGTAAYVITVGATNDQDGMTDYSSNGDLAKNEFNLIKPDVVAPGGTFQSEFGNRIVSADSNDVDGEYSGFADRNANDYQQMGGTSMATPQVAGLAALVTQAMGNWNWTQSDALKVKMLISMTASETQNGESTNLPPLNRGDKDGREGYGRINADAAIEAVTMTYTLGQPVAGTLGSSSLDRKVWARRVSLSAGSSYKFDLTVPPGADYDLYVYDGVPDSYGQPIVVKKSVSASNLVETFEYAPTVSGEFSVVVKWVGGNGSFTLEVVENSQHDVSVFSVVPSSFAVYVGGTVDVSVEVGNQGTLTETFDVTLLFNGSAIGIQTVVDLPASMNVTLVFEWNTTGLLIGRYVLSAVASQVPGEIEILDNDLTGGVVRVKRLGDVNGDGKVNILDAVVLSLAYGASVGEPGYNQDADINDDGTIDVFDAIILSTKWSG